MQRSMPFLTPDRIASGLHGNKHRPLENLPHYTTQLMDIFHIIQALREDVSTSIHQVSAHVYTRVR